MDNIETNHLSKKMFSGEIKEESLRIKIIGVGGAGCNAVDRIKLDDLTDVHLAAVNTDIQSLAQSLVQEKIQIGRNVTHGMSAGGDAELGREAAESERQALEKLVDGCDLVFLVAGLGGGTGSGAAPLIAKMALDAGAMVIAFVMHPFSFEKGRLSPANEAHERLRKDCHAVIALPNDLLLQLGSKEQDPTFLDACSQADEWVSRGIKSICSMLLKTGLINQDFGSLRRIFSEKGTRTLFGLGTGSGEDHVQNALSDLSICPLLHATGGGSRRADNLLVHITGGPDLTMSKVNQIIGTISDKLGSRENLILGAMIDDALHQRLEICVIGTTSLSRKGYSNPPAAAVSQNRPGFSDPVPERVAAPTSKPTSVHESKLKVRTAQANLWDQNEFEFLADEEQRGFFDKTERNLYEGVDLDVPTYLRRGIRISLKE